MSENDVIILSAALISHSRLDDMESCEYLLRRYWRNFHLRSSVPLDRQSSFFLEANAAEAYCSLGDIAAGALHSRRALSMSVSSAESFRAKSVLALCQALRGDMALASVQIAECDALAERNDSSWAKNSYILSVARILVLANSGDADGLLRTAATLRQIVGGGDPLAYAADVAVVQAQVLSGDLDEAVCLAGDLLACGSSRGHSIVRALLTNLYFDTLLLRGEPRRALAVLSACALPPSHVVCLEAKRAMALEMMGDYRSVLRVTQPCVGRLAEHSLRAAAAIMLVRGVAQYRLGEVGRARRSLTDGFRVAARAQLSLNAFIGLAGTELDEVAQVVGDLVPGARALVARLEEYRGSLPAPPSPSFVPSLTSREESLAWSIYHGASNKDIAEKDSVSVNTVKTQLRTLYRKLGVSSREQALSFLEERDFFMAAINENVISADPRRD
ncbi:LuxR C-terminal-related transcriptional regulator [Microbacterium sp. Kw_RZR3]|uniref:helix-turn-helix transcriptional regulator n=1 Tax=Microbacterium sp. Kw_RZR3 TaxID=3032903 RepID=UPI0023D9F187|nr:LuxR C-terminal-related transcriptional regulator [Microbacterium sp. Kw_RZR3]MDF2046543.1 LuxR C-terminal-related transcriptional regulator [Microbacterium sp. Kw_RZR3]